MPLHTKMSIITLTLIVFIFLSLYLENDRAIRLDSCVYESNSLSVFNEALTDDERKIVYIYSGLERVDEEKRH